MAPTVTAVLLATLQLLSPDAFCVDGTVRIQNKSYICRHGGFIDVSVVDAVTGSRYTNAQNPLVFHLRWDPGLVSDKQTARNFVVFYQEECHGAGAGVRPACNACATNLPCLRNITDGFGRPGQAHNGHMR